MGQTRPSIRIFIADSNLFYARGLQSLIRQSAGLCVVGEAASVDDLYKNVNLAKPDVLVMDGRLLASLDSRQFRTMLRAVLPSAQILVLATDEDTHTLEAALAVGARGYMLKTSKPGHILAALLSMGTQPDARHASGMVPDLKALADHTSGMNERGTLTNREKEVVQLLAEGKTVRAVASDLSLSAKTVEAHKLNLMRKLDIHDRASLIAYAAQNGMVAAA